MVCIPKIAACVPLMIGVDISDPNTPPLVIVNDPPDISSRESFFSLAFVARSAISFSISANVFLSVLRTDTTSPSSVDTAMDASKNSL